MFTGADVPRHQEICRHLPVRVGAEWIAVDRAQQLYLTDLVARHVARGREYRVAWEDGVRGQCQRGLRSGAKVACDAQEEERQHDPGDHGNCTLA